MRARSVDRQINIECDPVFACFVPLHSENTINRESPTELYLFYWCLIPTIPPDSMVAERDMPILYSIIHTRAHVRVRQEIVGGCSAGAGWEILLAFLSLVGFSSTASVYE